MSKEQLAEVRKQLAATRGYSMTGELNEAIDKAIEDDDAIVPLFDKYFECSLRHFGVRQLRK